MKTIIYNKINKTTTKKSNLMGKIYSPLASELQGHAVCTVDFPELAL